VTAKLDAGQGEVELSNDLLAGAWRMERVAAGMPRKLRDPLLEAAARLREPGDPFTRAGAALAPEIVELLEQYPLREVLTRGEQYGVWVDRPLARFGSWYEFFPRSTGGWDARGNPMHGTFATATKALPRVARMGFDVVYLPPIHPIGKVHRKGRNNSVTAAPNDVGSPWAIGSEEGGHDAVHPALGTIEDFDDFVAAARDQGMEIALDLALQCAPDHPWAKEHPEWFTVLPDGTIAYAENPPKKYQDIYPINFDNEPAGLYEEVLRVVRFWISHGVKVFRVDNPHTKPPNFWAWLIGEVKNEDPDVLFLAEAFTRPARLYGLAKLGFTQSYTYFTWRTSRSELTEFGEQIAEHADYARPNLFVNTRHPACEPAARRPRHVRDPGGAGVDDEFGMGRVLRLRAVRAPAGARRQRGVPELGEVRAAPPRFRSGAGRRRIAGAIPDPAQRDSPGASRAATTAHHHVPLPRQRGDHRLQQVRPGHR
jgi:starch synthase (maltosyl-transferring)